MATEIKPHDWVLSDSLGVGICVEKIDSCGQLPVWFIKDLEICCCYPHKLTKLIPKHRLKDMFIEEQEKEIRLTCSYSGSPEVIYLERKKENSSHKFEVGEKVIALWTASKGRGETRAVTYIKEISGPYHYILDEKTWPVTYPVSRGIIYKLNDPAILRIGDNVKLNNESTRWFIEEINNNTVTLINLKSSDFSLRHQHGEILIKLERVPINAIELILD